MAQVIWTETALLELESIGEFIGLDSIHYAQVTVSELFESTDVLVDHPRIGPKVPEFDREDVRQLNVGNYRIVYLIVSESQIDIISVHHGSRLVTNLKSKI